MHFKNGCRICRQMSVRGDCLLCQKFTVLPMYVVLTLQELQDKKNSKINTVTINVASYFPVTSI